MDRRRLVYAATVGLTTLLLSAWWVGPFLFGHEYMTEPKPGLATLASFGLWRRPFVSVRAPSDVPAAGNFTADGFDPERWKSHYPNQAFRHMDVEDAFWAARIVAAFTAESIGAIVSKAQFTDGRATDHITGTLLRRREKVLRTWLTALNPVVNPRVDPDGQLRFANAAESAAIADRPSEYEVTWFKYDNDNGVRLPLGEVRRFDKTSVPIPVHGLQTAQYAGVEVRTVNADYPAWSRPVRFYLRRTERSWTPVGIERDAPEDASGSRFATR
jgi:hypothetical protein